MHAWEVRPEREKMKEGRIRLFINVSADSLQRSETVVGVSLTPPGRNPQEPEGQQHADVQQHHGDEGQSAQDVVVGEEDEGLGEAEAGRQAVLQGEVLLAHRRAARRVLRTERSLC